MKLVRIQLDVSKQEEVEFSKRHIKTAEKDVTERIKGLLKKDKKLGLNPTLRGLFL